MKRTRNFQRPIATPTRSSPRNTRNHEKEDTESSGAIETGFVLPVISEENILSGRKTRSHKLTKFPEAEVTIVEEHVVDPINVIPLKNLPKKRTRELELLLKSQLRFPPSLKFIPENNRILRGAATRSSQRIASQIDRVDLKKEEELPVKATQKLPKDEISHSSTFILASTDSSSRSDTSSLEKAISISSSSFSSALKDIPTFDLLKSPSVLSESVMYLNTLKEKYTANVKEEKDRFLMPPPPSPSSRPKRVSSSGPDRKLEKMKAFVESIKPKAPEKDLTELNLEDEDENGCHPLVKELMSRCSTNDDNSDDDDSVQKTSCLSKFFPDYDKKFAEYKDHSEIIKNLTFPDLMEHFNAIRSDLKNIFDGKSNSIRNNLFLRGLGSDRRQLKDINVSIPFLSQQGLVLIESIYDFLIPKMDNRLNYSDYISFVLLPETYIRIYARVTGLNYQKAELEMRYGACYDEPKH